MGPFCFHYENTLRVELLQKLWPGALAPRPRTLEGLPSHSGRNTETDAMLEQARFKEPLTQVSTALGWTSWAPLPKDPLLHVCRSQVCCSCSAC